MQIKTIHKLHRALDTSKKVIKFAWRHIFVLASFAITIQGIYKGKTPILEGEVLAFSIAFFLDWLKTKIKFSGGTYNYAHEQMFESARRNRDDFSWKMNPLNPMGYTHHTYNDRSTNNYY